MTTNYSVFDETIVDMTYVEFEQALARGAIGLWGLGVVEEHGPHLPLGTDIYLPYVKARRACEILTSGGVEAVVLPPFYWGVNDVTSAFAGSIRVRPELMIELMADILGSLRSHGLQKAFCISGHLDTLHCQTIVKGLEVARERSGIDAYFVGAPALLERMECSPDLPHVLMCDDPDGERLRQYIGKSGPSGSIDLHAGRWETAEMIAAFPDLVRQGVAGQLPPTNLSFPDLVEWRKGGDVTRSVTPDGYFGSPAGATREDGERGIETEARLIAKAIAAAVK